MNNNSAHNNKRIIQAWSDAARNDDAEKSLDKFIDADCEWVMMATGETFRGIDEVKQMSLRSRDARKHTQEARIEFTNFFSSADQSQICIEYDHRAIITEEGARLFGMPPAVEGRSMSRSVTCATLKMASWTKSTSTLIRGRNRRYR
jgi:hypothetical protein